MIHTSNNRKRVIKLLLGIICPLVIMDAITKAVVRGSLIPGESIPVIGDILRITFVQNYTGFSWWVPALPLWAKIVFHVLMVSLALVAFPFYLFYTQTRRQNLWTDLAFVTIVAAILGHLFGDLLQPYTTDFIQIFHLPSANLSDIYAYAGIVALLVEMYLVYRLRKPHRKGLRSSLEDAVATRKEFIRFIRNGSKSSNNN
jgi:signal peptidase II